MFRVISSCKDVVASGICIRCTEGRGGKEWKKGSGANLYVGLQMPLRVDLAHVDDGEFLLRLGILLLQALIVGLGQLQHLLHCHLVLLGVLLEVLDSEALGPAEGGGEGKEGLDSLLQQRPKAKVQQQQHHHRQQQSTYIFLCKFRSIFCSSSFWV